MSYLISPDKFKGTLPAQEVGRIVGEVARDQDADALVDILPIADGGERTAALLAVQLGAQPKTIDTVDALGRPISAQYFVSETEAFLDMSAASGLWQIAKNQRQPIRSDTYGTPLPWYINSAMPTRGRWSRFQCISATSQAPTDQALARSPKLSG